jgi:pimeloyl-ACP methyl ester carboxylesterase
MPQVLIKGRRFAYNVAGNGPETVILETGFGAESSEWGTIVNQIANRAKVFWYDRAGRGESEPTTGPRDSLVLHQELNALLEASDVRPPFILVGHSFGGALMRLFAARRDRDVRGVVLVESIHHDQFDAIGPIMPEPVPNESIELTRMREFWRRGWKKPESNRELIDLPSSLELDKTVTVPRMLPLHVISASSFLNNPFLKNKPEIARMQETWDKLQASLLSLSSDSRQSYLADSGHFVQRDAPDAIADAIIPLLSA